MRTLGIAVVFIFSLSFPVTNAGEQPFPDLSSLPVGFKFCPAPGADNTDFNCSYYAIDAQTGQLSRYVDGQPRQDLGPVDTEEKLLFVAPPVNVENRYVPYPGAAPQQPPAEFANSNHGYNPNRPQYPAYSQQQPHPGQQYANGNPPSKTNKRPAKRRFLR